MRRTISVVVAVSLLAGLSLAALSQSAFLTEQQQGCVQTLDLNAAKIAKTQGRDSLGCLNLASKGSLGIPPTLAACFAADFKTKVAKAHAKAIAKELRECVYPAGLPAFAVPVLPGPYNPPTSAAAYNPLTHVIYSTTVNAAAEQTQHALAADLLGGNADLSVRLSATDEAGAMCQARTLKAVYSCAATRRKIYRQCKAATIAAGTANSTESLTNLCFVSGADYTQASGDEGKVATKCGSALLSVLTSACAGVNLVTALPGGCGAASNPAACLDQRVNCRLCQEANAHDGLGKDCDLFDDGSDNNSCANQSGDCGDGILDVASEQCDDGNLDEGDCCSSNCRFETAGSSCGSAIDSECSSPDTCNSAGVCQGNHESLGTPCGDPTDDDCTNADTCNGAGACQANQETAGTACGDPAATACTDPDTCNGSGVCLGNHGENGSPCPDDDNVCTNDLCDGSGFCEHPNNTSPCSDGLYCNGNDTCSIGTCSVHSGSPCAGADGDSNCAESCDEDADSCASADPDGAACTDGVFCNGSETCGGGVCGSSSGSPCPGADGDGNCSESCNEAAGNCTAADDNGSSCADGLFCNGTDVCSAGTCKVHTGNPCSGGNECSDLCNETTDACFDPVGTVCTDEGNTCTDDICSGGGTCVHPARPAAQPCPDDSNECTLDQCDGGGSCIHPPKVGGTTCTDDGNVCTNNQCNGMGACTGVANSAACNDGTFCNGADTCGGGSCSLHAGNPCPGPDGDANCRESCNETTDSCSANDPNGSGCNDALGCNGSDSCQNGTCTPSGVCCGTQNFTFTATSNGGGVFDSAEWPGGTQAQSSAAGCSATIKNPTNNIDLVCSLSEAFSVNSFTGFSNCFGTGGEDGDGCQPVSCPPAGVGSCCNGRPSCSAALNGSGSARYFVQCVDP